jgi:hypothetical protein
MNNQLYLSAGSQKVITVFEGPVGYFVLILLPVRKLTHSSLSARPRVKHNSHASAEQTTLFVASQQHIQVSIWSSRLWWLFELRLPLDGIVGYSSNWNHLIVEVCGRGAWFASTWI